MRLPLEYQKPARVAPGQVGLVPPALAPRRAPVLPGPPVTGRRHVVEVWFRKPTDARPSTGRTIIRSDRR